MIQCCYDIGVLKFVVRFQLQSSRFFRHLVEQNQAMICCSLGYAEASVEALHNITARANVRNCTSPDYGMLVPTVEIIFYCLRSHSSFSASRCTRVCTSNAWNMASVLFFIGVATKGESHPGQRC